ncbi:MAG: MFS transporter [Armatimonadota bacterium]|nr:MFS transporter [Armatimonadota bacterium]
MATNVDRSTKSVSSPGALFAACCFALVVSAVAFGIRSDIAGDLAKHFNTTKEAVGWFGMGGAFWGFAISIFIGGQLCDWLGMKTLLLVACVMQLAGVALTVFAPSLAILGVATWSIGIGNGLVEASINPMVASMFPNEKTRRLNLLHVWWPGGIVIGGLAGYFLGSHVSWQIKQSLVFIPAVIYGILFIGLKVPPTERVQSGVSTGAMYKELLRPLFLVFLFCMLLTAATELGPGQWMGTIMTKAAGSGILVLVWISLIMAVARLFAGPVVHKLSPTGILLSCAAVSIVGLLLMSKATSPTSAFVAATVFAVGVCYFWPTMLGFTSERFPAGGALLMGLMGTAGMTAAGFAQPVMGSLLDKFKDNPALSLQYAAFLPAVLVIIFGIVFLRDLSKGGYKAERLSARAEEAAALADGEA